MVPRTEVTFLDASRSGAEVRDEVRAYPHSRYPVVDGSCDHRRQPCACRRTFG